MNKFHDVRQHLQQYPDQWVPTGAASFIGLHSVEALFGLGTHVPALDNFAVFCRCSLDGVQERAGPTTWNNFSFIEGNMCAPATCAIAVKETDFVRHQATLCSPRLVADPAPNNVIHGPTS